MALAEMDRFEKRDALGEVTETIREGVSLRDIIVSDVSYGVLRIMTTPWDPLKDSLGRGRQRRRLAR